MIKTPDICICLDAGTANYEGLWVTSSLRGMVACNVKAQSIQSGQHSGTSGGIVPETFSGVCLECALCPAPNFMSPLPPASAPHTHEPPLAPALPLTRPLTPSLDEAASTGVAHERATRAYTHTHKHTQTHTVLRCLLDRIDDAKTGLVVMPSRASARPPRKRPRSTPPMR